MLDLCKTPEWRKHFSNPASWEPQGLWGLQAGGGQNSRGSGSICSLLGSVCLSITPVKVLDKESACDL